MEKEAKQEGAVEEQVKEETSIPVSEIASPEEKATSEKQQADGEWKRTMQSRTDKAEHEAKATKDTLQSVTTQLQTLRDGVERQRKENRKKELEAVGEDPEARGVVLRKQDLEDLELIHDNKWATAVELAKQYGFEYIDDILKADTPKEMKLMAELKAKGKTQSEAEQAKVETPKESFPTPDSATSDAAPSDFKQLRKNFIADPWKYGKAYKEALAKRVQ